ncbi:MAG: 8-oxo-dGTP diphosphatase [Thermoleophilales bacterium]|nr:8-oxo-dGTP diphosphatase [Thermoleophilales bacterium]
MRYPEQGIPEIRAAGGIVHRDGPEGTEVLVVHRPKYQDWSLPKGKLDPGETLEQAALREVEEETGVRAKLGPHVGSNDYRDRHGRSKRVDWYLMEPVDGDFEPNDEVDEIRWVPVSQARELLTHEDDYALLEQAGLA